MKKFSTKITGLKCLIAALILSVCVGCGDPRSNAEREQVRSELPVAVGISCNGDPGSGRLGVYEFEYNKHQYIMFRAGYGNCATAGIVHNPDCPCGKQ